MLVKSIRDYVNGAGMQLGSLAVKDKESGQIPDASKLMVGVGTPLSFVTDFWPLGCGGATPRSKRHAAPDHAREDAASDAGTSSKARINVRLSTMTTEGESP